MRNCLFALCLLFSSPLFAAESKAPPPASQPNETWKGPAPENHFTVGGMGGMAIVGNSVGGVILGSVATKIVNRGFVPDINNQVFIEFQAGPIFLSNFTVLGTSLHLRWDFHKDDDLTLYGLGGMGALLLGSNDFPSEFYPRFGAGVIWHLVAFDIRAEVSHEWITAGVQFNL